MIAAKIDEMLKAICEECGNENAVITGFKNSITIESLERSGNEIYYFKCPDCENVFSIEKEPN